MSSLDGLRALAVIGVIIYHAEPSLLPGGFLGVDVFFVISGYLITALLLREHDSTHHIDMRRFWRRRARRLGPALLVMLSVVVVVGRLWLPSSQWGSLRGDELASLGYVMNWRLILTGDSYFSTFAVSPLRHVWSLSVEEQFYLVWPIVAAIAMARSRRALALVASAAFVASIAAMTLVGGGLSRVYYGTDTRLHVIMAGCLLAILESKRPDLVRRLGASTLVTLIGVAALGGAMVFIAEDNTGFFPAGLVIFAAVTMLVVAGCSTQVTLPLLSNRALVEIGRRSYGLYLWHWPVMVFLTDDRLGIGHVPATAIRVAVFSTLTWASYRFLERPVLARRAPLPRWWPLAPIGVIVLVLASTAGATANRYQQQAGGATGTVQANQGITAPTGAGGTPIDSLLLIGDSVAASIQEELARELAGDGVSTASAVRYGCGIVEGMELTANGDLTPMAPGCPKHQALQDQLVAQQAPDVILVIAQVDSYRRKLPDGTVIDFEESPDEYLALLNKAVDRLTVGGATMVIALPANVAYFNADAANVRYEAWRGPLRTPDAERSEVVLLDLQSLICPESQCIREIDGTELRPDGMHYSDDSATLIVPRIVKALFAALGVDT